MIDKHSVCIGYIHPGKVDQAFSVSLMNCIIHNMVIKEARYLQGTSSACGVVLAALRNEVVWDFLRRHKEAEQNGRPSVDWLLFLDTDISFPTDLIEQFAQFVDPIEAPIVAGRYDGFPKGPELQLPIWVEGEYGTVGKFVGDPDNGPELRPLIAAGMGCCMIHRDVLIKMLIAHQEDEWPWFGHDVLGKKRLGEDVTFFWRAQQLGYPIFGAKSIQVGHFKTREITSRTFVPILPKSEELKAQERIQPTVDVNTLATEPQLQGAHNG